MENMNTIKSRLEKMGYSLYRIDEEMDVGKLITDILEYAKKTGDSRIIKAIPFIIYQSSPAGKKRKEDKPVIDLKRLGKLSEGRDAKIELNAILYYTKEIFKKLNLSGEWVKEIEKFLEKFSIDGERKIFLEELNIQEINLREELKHEFLMQKRIKELERETHLIDKIKTSEDRNMKYYLSWVFSPKQREIIEKIIDEKPLNKTEYEYYIRVIKKRLEAIAELEELAKTAISKRPKKNYK